MPYREIERDDDIWSEVLKALLDAELPEDLIFATVMTERFVTEENKKFLTAEEIAEWKHAFDVWGWFTRSQQRDFMDNLRAEVGAKP